LRGKLKPVRHRLEYGLLRGLASVCDGLSPAAASNLGGALGRIAWDVLRYRREVALENLAEAIRTDAVREERERIARMAAENLGRTLAEFIRFARLPAQRVRELAPLVGSEHFDRAREVGRGALLVSGHFGNWELLGSTIAAHGYPVDVFTGRQTNPHVDAFAKRLRRSRDLGVIPGDAASPRRILRSLRAGRFVAFLFDQDARSRGIFVDFLGRPASTPRAPARLALRAGCPLIFGVLVREGPGSYRAHVGPSLHPDPTAERADEILRLTRGMTRELESWVRRHPDHYLWTHRRWKTRPPGGMLS
jgi:KDO2-lipid IV(A) lauroyltransferase